MSKFIDMLFPVLETKYGDIQINVPVLVFIQCIGVFGSGPWWVKLLWFICVPTAGVLRAYFELKCSAPKVININRSNQD